ncbi:MAG: cupin domain-containing protein [Porticoccaceae bacterium]|nr:cupin domain-containing protein [Porticoccaceae bacterium]
MDKTVDWQIFQLPELISRVRKGTVSLDEFLRTPSLSCAIYHVPAGSNEMSKAHEEDELYVVLEGKGRLRVGDTVHEVSPGTMMYVHAACDHSYFDVEEDITTLVMFGAVPKRAHLSRR